MPFAYAIPLLIFALIVALLLWLSYRAFRWALVSGSNVKTGFVQRATGSLLGLLILAPMGYPFVRDTYRNHLCETEGGADIRFDIANWKLAHATELNDIHPIALESRQSQLGPDTWRTLLNSRFAIDERSKSRALGVAEKRFALIDLASGTVLAATTSFDTGGWGQPWPAPSLGRPVAQSCSSGWVKFSELRDQLQRLTPR
jgi:hypothetical protein